MILTEDLYLKGHTGGSFKFCLPGWGDVKWPAFFRTLWEGGYKGNVIVEHEDDMFKGDQGFRIARAYLNTLLPKLIRAILILTNHNGLYRFNWV